MDGKYELDAAKIIQFQSLGVFSLFISLNRSNLVSEEQRNSPKHVLNFNKNPNFDAKASELWKVRWNIILCFKIHSRSVPRVLGNAGCSC